MLRYHFEIIEEAGWKTHSGATQRDGIQNPIRFGCRPRDRSANYRPMGVVGGGWQTDSVIPCGSNWNVAREKCDPSQYYGKPLSLILAVEHDGKKHEYRIDGKVNESPAFAAWQEKQAAKKKR